MPPDPVVGAVAFAGVVAVVQNAAGIDLNARPERIAARLAELEQDAADAKAAREQESTTAKEPTE